VRQIERTFTQVTKDAASLVRSIPSERNTVTAVLKRLEDRSFKLGVKLSHKDIPIVTESNEQEKSSESQPNIPDQLRVQLKKLPSVCEDNEKSLFKRSSTSDCSSPNIETKVDAEKRIKNQIKEVEKTPFSTLSSMRKLPEEVRLNCFVNFCFRQQKI